MMCPRPSPAPLIACFICALACDLSSQAQPKFAGTFHDDHLTLICTSDAAGSAYMGTIVMRAHDGNKRFPFTAAEQAGALVGSFKSGDSSHEFRATFENDTLVLRTGNTDYRLSRAVQPPPIDAAPSGAGRGLRPRIAPPPIGVPGRTRSQQIEDAIKAAREYLYSHQKNGNWDRPERAPEPQPDARGLMDAMDHAHSSQWGGMTALATYSLLAAGERPDEPALAASIDWLTKADITGTYALACRALVWNQMPASRKRQYLDQAKRDRDRLLANRQTDQRFRGMFHYKADSLGFDHSNSQFGVLGLWAVSQAGAEVPTQAWKEFEAAWQRTQLESGGWSYSPLAVRDETVPTASMTAAGVATLFITFDQLHANAGVDCRGNLPHKSIDAGMSWIVANYEQTFKGMWPIYTLYGMERIGLASGYKYFGAVDWYKNGVDYLLANQNQSGSWGRPGSESIVDTSFGILFLVRGRAPVVMNKLQYELDVHGDTPKPANWHQRPRDCANLVRWMSGQLERELAWQIVNLKGPVEDLHDSPILFISGNQILSFTPDEEQKLKTFVHQGGLIVGHADCNHQAFTDSFKKLGQRLFSPYEFRNLPAGHLINTILFQRSKWKTPVPLQGLSNGARELMILISGGDPGRYWQNRVYAGREASHEFMANLFLYVSERKDLRNRGESHIVSPDSQIQPTTAVRIARLEYPGNWNPEPGGWQRLTAVLHNESRLDLQIEPIKLGEGKLSTSGIKLAHLTGTAKFTLTDAQRKELKAFLDAGGTLLADACGGAGEAADSINSEMSAILGPTAKPAILKPDHALYSRIDGGPDSIALRPYAAKLVAGNFKGPRLRAIEINNRPAVILSHEDLSLGLVGQPIDGIIGYTPASATALVKSILLWEVARASRP